MSMTGESSSKYAHACKLGANIQDLVRRSTRSELRGLKQLRIVIVVKSSRWQLVQFTQKHVVFPKQSHGKCQKQLAARRLSVAQYQRFVIALNDRNETAKVLSCEADAFSEEIQSLEFAQNRRANVLSEHVQYHNMVETFIAPKNEHSLMDCQGCAQRYSQEKLLFPVK